MAISRQKRPPRSSRIAHLKALGEIYNFWKIENAWIYWCPTPNASVYWCRATIMWIWSLRMMKNVSEWLVMVLQAWNPPPRKESLHDRPLDAKCNWELGETFLITCWGYIYIYIYNRWVMKAAFPVQKVASTKGITS